MQRLRNGDADIDNRSILLTNKCRMYIINTVLARANFFNNHELA